MGRAKVVMTHIRSVEMAMSAVTITYKIPLYGERAYIGEFKSICVKDGNLVVSYGATEEAKEYIKPPITFEQISTDIEFK